MPDRYNLVSELKKKYALASSDERKNTSSTKSSIGSGSASAGASAAKNATTGTSGLRRGTGVQTQDTTPVGKATGKASGNTGARLIPNDEEKEQIDRVDKLPADFPIDKWDDMTTKEQLKVMQSSGLSAQDQWRLLNTPISLQTLSLMNAALNGQKSGAFSGQEATDLFNRAHQYELDKQAMTPTDASFYPLYRRTCFVEN